MPCNLRQVFLAGDQFFFTTVEVANFGFKYDKNDLKQRTSKTIWKQTFITLLESFTKVDYSMSILIPGPTRPKLKKLSANNRILLLLQQLYCSKSYLALTVFIVGL